MQKYFASSPAAPYLLERTEEKRGERELSSEP
jgi:hypothetical protein